MSIGGSSDYSSYSGGSGCFGRVKGIVKVGGSVVVMWGTVRYFCVNTLE